MRQTLTLSLLAILTLLLPAEASGRITRSDSIVAELHKPQSSIVLVAAHRGDWRNWPENSLPALQSAISMGADIVEIDLQMTRDSVLVLCHDRTVDRTTTGHGRVSDMTCDSIRSFRLKAGHGVATELCMPTLREALMLCKDRVVVNIDKGYEYYDEVLALCDTLDMAGQVLIKGTAAPDDVARKFGIHDRNLLYMPIVNLARKGGPELYGEYVSQGIVPMAYELCWPECSPEVDALMAEMIGSGAKLWVNSLWPSLNGGLCDDAAYTGNPDDIYGRLIESGATIIQCDRLQFLLDYLRANGHHR